MFWFEYSGEVVNKYRTVLLVDKCGGVCHPLTSNSFFILGYTLLCNSFYLYP